MVHPVDEYAVQQLNEFNSMEILCMVDPVDEYAVQQLTEFNSMERR